MRIVARALAMLLSVGALAGFILLSKPPSAAIVTQNGKIVNINSGTSAIVAGGTSAIVAITQ